MPDLEISNLPALAEAGVAATDPLAIADLSASETKKVTVKDLIEAGVALIDAGSIPSAKVASLGSNQVATGSIIDGAVINAKLANSSISLGGVSIALGATDATPAFNLADATGYTTANLSGTITNAQLAGSIANSKLANSSVSFGGISLALGGTDATPAFNLTDATGYKTTELVGTITNAQLAGSIDVSKLVGSTVSFGGVSVALGAADATPAFNLTDATGYPTSALVGTITNAQLAGSIANAKLANSSVSFGGVTVALGASDATPAFDLTDATNYPTSSLTGTITNAQLAGSIAVAKLVSSSVSFGGVSVALGTADATPAFNLTDATGYPTTALVGTITNAQLAGSIDATKIVSNSITSTQLGANSVTDSELANNAVDTAAVQNGAITNDKVETSTNSSTGLDGATKLRDGTITAGKLNTSNLDRSLNVASGNLGINNAVSGGASTRSGISFNAEGLITSTVALGASDLPLATTSAVGGVSVGAGLSVNGSGVLTVSNSVTAVSGAVKVNYNAQGAITGSSSLASSDLPTATTAAKGAVQITSGGGLTVDGSGNLTTSTSGVSAGTYQSVVVNNKGVITSGAALTAALVPDLSAAKITSGTLNAARIAPDSIDSTKLSNSSTTVIQSIAQDGYPTAAFTGMLLFDPIAEDAYLWDGNAWNPITTLTKGALVRLGTYNANTSQVDYVTAAGSAAGLTVGQNLPVASESVDGGYVVISVQGTPSGVAGITGQLSPPDYLLGVTASATSSSWVEIDLSTTVASQQASAISYTPHGQLSSTNVQLAINELENEKLSKAGGTVTGEVLIGVSGSLVFEGTGSDDAFETTLTVANPTTSDKTITLPNVTGTVITSGDTGTVNSTMIANDTIQNVDVKSDAAIAYSKLASVASGYLLVGNGASPSVAAAVAVTGDISINNAGLTSIAAGVIVDADIKSDAEISGSKIVDATTSVIGVVQLEDSTTSTSTVKAATPASVKVAKDVADAALPKDGSSLMTGHLQVDNDKELRLFEADSNGSAYIGIKGATDKGSEASYTISLPAAAPATGQVLKAGSTATTLEWAAAATAAADITGNTLASGVTASSLTSLGTLTGLTINGDVTFTGDTSNGSWDKSASAFVANLTGNVSGNVSGSSGSCTGNAATATLAATATALATARAINGTNFDGSADITVTAAAGTLTGTELKSTVVTSSLTSVGTLTGLTVSGDVSIADKIVHTGDTNTALRFPAADTFSIETGGSERARVDSSGRLLLGHTSNINNGTVQIVSDGSALDCLRFAASEYGSHLNLLKSRSGTVGTNTIVNDNDDIGTLSFRAADASNYIQAASIKAEVDGTPGNADMPGRLVFSTTADGASSATERMRIDSSGRVAIGSTSFGDTYEYLRVQAASGAGNPSNVSIIGGNNSHSTLNLGDTDDFNIQRIKSDHSNNSLILYTDNDPTLTLDSSHNATFAGTVSDSKGNLRSIPQNQENTHYTLVASDAGKHVLLNGGTSNVTVANNFAIGDAITIINRTGANSNILESSVTLVNAADGSTGTRVLANHGMVTILFITTGIAYISGAGLS